jgi:NADH-quinone oxidoreductase subunit M
MPNLIWLFAIPFLAAIVTFISPMRTQKGLKYLAVMMSFIPLIMLLSQHANWIGEEARYAWLPALSIYFHLQIDSLSLPFLYLASVVVPISLLAVQREKLGNPRLFYGLVLLLQGLLMGFFMAQDLAVFVIFWEAMLFPLYFIILLWGKEQRQTAALQFLIYMIAGSALMVAAVLALYFSSFSAQGTGTFNIRELAQISRSMPYAWWTGAIFFLAFAVKTPLFPFHAWLPAAYYQASTPGTILLSGILSKAGIYGFLRIGAELFPSLIREWSPLLLELAIFGVFYGGLIAWKQHDFKRLLAYSSFSHVNFILAGIFVWSQTAQTGAIFQALNHGVTISALFLVAGWLEERIGSTDMGQVNGAARAWPLLCWFTLIFVLSSIALPGMNNFIGEFLILFGLFGEHPWAAVFLTLTVILSALYMLRWMQKVYFGPFALDQENHWDIRGKEAAIAIPLIGLVLWMGLYPAPILQQIQPAAQKMIAEEP